MDEGQIIGARYIIVEELGSGSFGDTYIAKDTKFPGEPDRVVKHLCPKAKDPQTLKVAARLFKTEAESLAKLGEHDCIPRLFAYFEEDKEFFIVQELIEGQDLVQEFAFNKKWTEEKTIEFLRELLSILSVVHEQGTIHRDIKPANIMRRNNGKIVLIDFGAVKQTATVDKNGKTPAPKDSTVSIGTLAYMPLEQARGKPGVYSDVYTVGMLGIQALTGLTLTDLPHDCDSFKATLKKQQITISSKLESVLCKMIKYQPCDRYQDATEALEALLLTPNPNPNPDPIPEPIPIPEPDPIPLPDPEPTYIEPKFPKKLLLGALGAIALAVGAGGYFFQSSNKPDYAQLEIYLQSEQWQQADAETDKIILQVAKENSALDASSINNFDCDSLQKIDELWIANSDGRFGFTPQSKVYLDAGNEFDKYTQTAYETFGDRLGWRIFGVWSLYKDLKFTEIAPKGHLPSPGRKDAEKNDLRIRERGDLLARFNSCGL